jgi:predicted phage tail protein
MMNDIHGAGGGGGSSQHTPVESPDSLRSLATFRILDLISEGEIAGLVNGQQSIYLNETPLVNPDGSLNFQNVQVDARNGT